MMLQSLVGMLAEPPNAKCSVNHIALQPRIDGKPLCIDRPAPIFSGWAVTRYATQTISRFFRRLCLFCFVLLAGCGLAGHPAGPSSAGHDHIKTIVVAPFKSFLANANSGPGMRCPICGAALNNGPIKAGADQYMTKQLMAYLKSKTTFELIPPQVAEGVRSKMISEHVAMRDRRLMINIGVALHADAVLSGIIYRFREREGTSLAVESPASVGFGLHLIRIRDGRLIWVKHFDETQQTLSENLFKLGTFLRRGGTWLSADELAISGLNKIMADFPAP